MPRVFDNIERRLLPALRETMELSDRADFSVGYFNLRGWKAIDACVERWAGGNGQCCRLLVGMQRLPQDEVREAFSLSKNGAGLDSQTAIRLKNRLATEFRNQLLIGAPTNADEEGLRRLARQIRQRKVVVKLYLRHPLHAKLYLLFRQDPVNPITGYLGSSNLTFAGLSEQGELNVDVVDSDASEKLAAWFEERWNDRWCLDISEELASIIEESWAREDLVSPYLIYLKIAYHLSHEARAGLTDFAIPREFQGKLFEFQKNAVQIAAEYLHRRNGVLIGDVVGLGKTMMATALAKIFEEDFNLETLIICPKNLVEMWRDYVHEYRLHAHVLPLSMATRELPDLRRYRLVLIDESHNLRNREGQSYRAIQEYITANESKCILLTATPYNKTYLDLASQLRLFVPEEQDLGIRPERLIDEIGEAEFIRRHQAPVRSLAAFEKSEHTDDWRDLMRLYLVRRTRSFIRDNYAAIDPDNGRAYLTFPDGTRSYFPTRMPKALMFKLDEQDATDQYARLYAPNVVDAINHLRLPRYGLGNYVTAKPQFKLTDTEKKTVEGLSRAGQRLMGFSRTNLFKRLESSGPAFLQSVERHILRNFVFLHALEHDLPIPIGTQDVEALDTRTTDEDADAIKGRMIDENGGATVEDAAADHAILVTLRDEQDYRQRAAEIYSGYTSRYRRRFKWVPTRLFADSLGKDLLTDAHLLLDILHNCGDWDTGRDAKLNALHELLVERHPYEKVLVFSQFADTVRYLTDQLTARGVRSLEGVTGDAPNPTDLAWRFSPVSNDKRDRVSPDEELRALIATDVLSEGQNLQDGHIIVNYDLPWAIIRLIQRAGRVDRIGQRADQILCYSFLPAEGVERIINLRGRVRQRLQENAEVVGADEVFFEDERNDMPLLALYHERADVLEGDADAEVDLASHAYHIWKNATDANPALAREVAGLPDVVYATRQHTPTTSSPEGVLVFLHTADGTDALAWMDREGRSISQSQLRILDAASCPPNTPGQPRHPAHHELVQKGVEHLVREDRSTGGQLGRPSGARYRVYTRLKAYAEQIRETLFNKPELHRAIDDIYRHPLRSAATDTLNRQLRSGIDDDHLAELVIRLRDEDRLSLIHEIEEESQQEPQIVCSLGLFQS